MSRGTVFCVTDMVLVCEWRHFWHPRVGRASENTPKMDVRDVQNAMQREDSDRRIAEQRHQQEWRQISRQVVAYNTSHENFVGRITSGVEKARASSSARNDSVMQHPHAIRIHSQIDPDQLAALLDRLNVT